MSTVWTGILSNATTYVSGFMLDLAPVIAVLIAIPAFFWVVSKVIAIWNNRKAG